MWFQLILLANLCYMLATNGYLEFCCSNTCCCSLCTKEQCDLPDQPGKQCRCHNTTTIICSRSRRFVYQPVPIIQGPEPQTILRTGEPWVYEGQPQPGSQIIGFVPGPYVPVPQMPVLGNISGLEPDPLCCSIGNCPEKIKCKHPPKPKSSTTLPMPLPLFILACVLFVLIIITTIGVGIAASLYVNDWRKQRHEGVEY